MKLKFSSISRLLIDAGSVIRRFPAEVLFALTGTIAATIAIDRDGQDPLLTDWCIRILMAASIGLVFSLALNLFLRARAIKGVVALVCKVAAAVSCGVFVFLLNPAESSTDYLRFVLLSLAVHLLVSFAAFTGPGTVNAFWQFNKTLFLRFLSGALYSTVLYAGIAASLGSLNFLFGFRFEFETFAIVWAWTVGLFQTFYVLAGMPVDFTALKEDQPYPNGLKVFAQYVLIPLTTLYLGILLAYELKITFTWSLPKGMVSNLVLGYSVFGMLSLLLVYPIRDLEENRWIKTFSRNFYFLMIPLLFLLFVAVGARVLTYGITEERYFLIVLAVWLGVVAVYFLAWRGQNIKFIPVSLCVAALLCVYGPQSAFFVARYSQQRRLERFLHEKRSAGTRDEIRDLTDYLVRHHGVRSVQRFVKADVDRIKQHFTDSIGKKNSQRWEYQRYAVTADTRDSILRLMGVGPHEDESRLAGNGMLNLNNELGNVIAVDGPALFMSFSTYNRERVSFNQSGIRGALEMDAGGTLRISIEGSRARFSSLDLLKSLKARRAGFRRDGYQWFVPDSLMTRRLMVGGRKVRIRVESLGETGDTKNEKYVMRVDYCSGQLVISR